MSEIYKFDVSGFEVKGNELSRTVKGTAYSGNPILNHPSWGNVIFDLSSTRSEQVIPLLLQHNSGRIAGYTDYVTIGDSIIFSGSLLQSTDAGQEIVKLSEQGFPWQMSVHIQPEYTINVAGEIVNGQRFTGTVFKKSVIREISFCPVGADANTSARLFNQNNKTFLADLMSETVNQQAIQDLHRA